jgi:hypothetical protein
LGEEQHVARLLLNDGLEDRDERRREEAGPPGEIEQSEGEERIEAFAVLGAYEGPLQIGGQRVGDLLGEGKPIAVGHEPEKSRMPCLFVSLELDRPAKEGVALHPTKGGDSRRCIGLGGERFSPERQRA